MKLSSAILFAALALGVQAAPYVAIGDLKLYKAYSLPGSQFQQRGYLPVGDDIGHYNRLLSVRIVKQRNDPEAYLLEEAALVTKSARTARYQYLRNAKTGELVLDCMLPRPESLKEGFAEWSLMRARAVEGGGLVVYQYVMRIYGVEDKTSALVERERNKMLGPFQDAAFEEEGEPAPGQRP